MTSYDDALDSGGGGIPEPHTWMGGDGPEDELREATLEAVRSLPETLRSAVYLFYYEQMSVRRDGADVGHTAKRRQDAPFAGARQTEKKRWERLRYAQE